MTRRWMIVETWAFILSVAVMALLCVGMFVWPPDTSDSKLWAARVLLIAVTGVWVWVGAEITYLGWLLVREKAENPE